MSKEIYVPVDGIAHKVTKIYAPVNGVARSVKKVYKGVSGIARQVFEALPPVGTALNDMTWAQIRAISDAGLASRYFSVGDTKTITINGTVGVTTFDDLEIDAFIIGIDHNSEKEGANRIHFKIGKINGLHVSLVDKYFFTQNTSVVGLFSMSTVYGNFGGWQESFMRKTLLGNDGTPTAPLENSLMAALPADLRVVLKSVTKYGDNAAGGTGDKESNISATTDYLFLLSEFEYMGERKYANLYEQNHQEQYEYFQNDASEKAVHLQHSALGQLAAAWTRSPQSSSETGWFVCISVSNEKAFSTNQLSYYSMGLSPAFCV